MKDITITNVVMSQCVPVEQDPHNMDTWMKRIQFDLMGYDNDDIHFETMCIGRAVMKCIPWEMYTLHAKEVLHDFMDGESSELYLLYEALEHKNSMNNIDKLKLNLNDIVYLETLYVPVEFRGNNIGSILIDEIVNYFHTYTMNTIITTKPFPLKMEGRDEFGGLSDHLTRENLDLPDAEQEKEKNKLMSWLKGKGFEQVAPDCDIEDIEDYLCLNIGQ